MRLGLILRSILVSPRVGFESALEASRRRDRIKEKSSEGAAPFVLSAVGGATLMLLWLKLGGMADLREVGRDDYAAGLLVASLVAGALIGLGAQWLWSAIGGAVSGLLARRATPRELRLVWGAAAFPQIFSLLLLLPLDLVIVGPAAFTTEPMSDSLSTAWAALSVALAVTIAAWSAFLFVRGVQVATGLGPARTGAAVLTAVVSVALVAGAGSLAAASLAGLSG